MPKENQQVLKSLLEVVNTKGHMADFVEAFKFAVDTLNKMKAATGSELSQLRITFDSAVKDLNEKHVTGLSDIKGQINTALDKALKIQETSLNQLRDSVTRMQQGKQGNPGEPGLDADEQSIIQAVLAQMPTPIIPDAYDDAEIQAQIDEHTKAIEELRSSGKNIPGWGAHPLHIYQSGTIKAETAQHLNFTGANITQSPDGVTTVAITGAGFVGSQEKSTTIPNGSQQTFAFTHTPLIIYWNGQMQTLTDDYTVSSNNITFTGTIIPQTGDKIVNVYA